MVEQINANAELNPTSDVSIDTAPTVKKTRKPRRTKAEMEAATVSGAAEGRKLEKKTRVKRGTKGVTVKAQRAIGRKSVASTTPAAPFASIDDLADLIKLEEENKSLRNQLSDKLRAENADLRKRLGQS